VKLPSVEVRYKNLNVEAECEVVQGKPLPTLWNSFSSLFSVSMHPPLTYIGMNQLCKISNNMNKAVYNVLYVRNSGITKDKKKRNICTLICS
jgi:hypothetical protein